MSELSDPASIEDALDALQRESQARRAELRAIAVTLPEVQSRRSTVRVLLADLRANLDVVEASKRAVAKLGRAPRAITRRVRGQ